MVRGFYTAGSGILTSTKKIDILANNVSNTQTPGYKQDKAVTTSFGDSLAYRNDGVSSQELGNIGSGQALSGTGIDFMQGTLSETDNMYDLAIYGDGFFTVQTAGGGVEYTRNGCFSLNNEGYITDSNGSLLMGNNGAIYTGGKSFVIDSDGSVTVDGVYSNKLEIYNPADTAGMKKLSDGCFAGNGGAQKNTATGSICQGSLEASNSDMIDGMMEMIESQNSLQSCSAVLKMIDETLEQAVKLGNRE